MGKRRGTAMKRSETEQQKIKTELTERYMWKFLDTLGIDTNDIETYKVNEYEYQIREFYDEVLMENSDEE